MPMFDVLGFNLDREAPSRGQARARRKVWKEALGR
jgi:hypothetical protein